MENRLTELETKVAYQDQIIEDLNQLVIEQQKQVAQLSLQYKKIKDQLSSESGSNVVDVSLEVPPPHY